MIKKKVCLIGAYAVGKTSLVQQYVHSFFSDKYLTTVGVRIDKKSIYFKNQEVDLIIWDLYGEDDFQTVRMSYLRGASGCFYVVDGTRGPTLRVAMELQERAEKALGPIPSIIAVNKLDLEPYWEIDSPTIEALNSRGVPVIKTSAKTGDYVESAFMTLTRLMLEAV